MKEYYIVDVETIPVPLPEQVLRTFIPEDETDVDKWLATSPMLAQIVAVGFMHVTTGNAVIALDGSCFPKINTNNPKMNIKYYDHESGLLHGVNGSFRKRDLVIITFNGRGFDIPVLVHRSIVNAIKPAPLLMEAMNQKPWLDEPHYDLMAKFTLGGIGRKYPLAAYAVAYGLPNPKEHGSGARVAELAKTNSAESTEQISKYLLGDLETERQLYLRWES